MDRIVTTKRQNTLERMKIGKGEGSEEKFSPRENGH